jgi:hypothetical protein
VRERQKKLHKWQDSNKTELSETGCEGISFMNLRNFQIFLLCLEARSFSDGKRGSIEFNGVGVPLIGLLHQFRVIDEYGAYW